MRQEVSFDPEGLGTHSTCHRGESSLWPLEPVLGGAGGRGMDLGRGDVHPEGDVAHGPPDSVPRDLTRYISLSPQPVV